MLQHLIRSFRASYHTAKVDKGGLLEPFFCFHVCFISERGRFNRFNCVVLLFYCCCSAKLSQL